MSDLTRDEVAKVAALARLSLTVDELDRFTAQLSSVLSHATDMGSLDLDGVAPTAHPFELVNVLRDDVAGECLNRDEVLAQAPDAQDGRFGVPRVGAEP
ncbi:MAG: Asp-tRNA(Asn)/Glu-tRNA(Gln) amidotransferase subunit GatC [Acidimicrobiales bacterium]